MFHLAISLVAGLLLGVLFFGGLWLTVRWLDRVRYPALWMLGSLITRLAVVLGGIFALLKMGNWLSAVVAVIGMLLVRVVLNRHLQPQKAEVVS